MIDWPLSYKQTGRFRSDYFNNRFNGQLTDEERIESALKIWENGTSRNRNYDLVMTYIVGTDSAGHHFGPRDSRMVPVIDRVDTLVGNLRRRVEEIAKKKYGLNYEVFLLITTDHGMSEVKQAVNIRLLSKLNNNSPVRTITGGNVGHIFLDQIYSHKKRSRIINQLRKEYKKYPFVTFYTKNQLPRMWNYNHPTRVGDIVVVLDPGITFSAGARRTIVPIAELGGPMGMHGYDPRDEKEMQGIFVLYRYPEFPRGAALRTAPHSLELHPSVAHLLGIRPAPKAHAQVIPEIRRLR